MHIFAPLCEERGCVRSYICVCVHATAPFLSVSAAVIRAPTPLPRSSPYKDIFVCFNRPRNPPPPSLQPSTLNSFFYGWHRMYMRFFVRCWNTEHALRAGHATTERGAVP